MPREARLHLRQAAAEIDVYGATARLLVYDDTLKTAAVVSRFGRLQHHGAAPRAISS
jgi:hypothetical protein